MTMTSIQATAKGAEKLGDGQGEDEEFLTQRSDPLSLLRGMRQEAIEKLQKSYNELSREGDFQMQTLEEVIRSIQALLTTNAEIWERCQEYRVKQPTESSSSTTGNIGGIFFRRLICDRVLVKSETTDGTSNNSMFDVERCKRYTRS